MHTDSAYLINAFERQWIAGWLGRRWLTTARKPVENRDLWERLIGLIGYPGFEPGLHEVSFVKVAGHAGIALNERCDRLALAARDRPRINGSRSTREEAHEFGERGERSRRWD
ncbi:MAG TPA: RNase H family protein [Gaiellaceae bacterium]|nr:RNase H family protein [Gaiellaceae bacterium]